MDVLISMPNGNNVRRHLHELFSPERNDNNVCIDMSAPALHHARGDRFHGSTHANAPPIKMCAMSVLVHSCALELGSYYGASMRAKYLCRNPLVTGTVREQRMKSRLRRVEDKGNFTFP